MGSKEYSVLFFVLLCLVAFNIGAFLKRQYKFISVAQFPYPKSNFAVYSTISAYFILSLLFVASITEKNPLDMSIYSLDFGEVYSEYGNALSVRSVGITEILITLLKAALFPFIALIFVSRFGKDWIAIILIVLPMIMSSLLRGTDKEIFDVMLLIGVTAFYKGMIGRKAIIYMSFIPVFFALFLLRRLGRFGEYLPPCLPGTSVCFDFNSFISTTFGESAEILYVFVTNYLCQGYEGLSISFNLPFDFNYFVGHMQPVKRGLCTVIESVCLIPDYQEKLYFAGWDTTNRWYSAYPALANDLTFYLVPLYFLLIGVAFRRAERLWKDTGDFASLLAIIMITNLFIFSSANLQIAVNLDWSACLILFVYIAAFRSAKVAR